MKPISRRTFVQMASGSALAAWLPATVHGTTPQNASSEHLLWFDKPAAAWIDALPIGNGLLGAMVFGDDEHGDRRNEWAAVERVYAVVGQAA